MGPQHSDNILWFISPTTWKQYGSYLRFRERNCNTLFLLYIFLLLSGQGSSGESTDVIGRNALSSFLVSPSTGLTLTGVIILGATSGRCGFNTATYKESATPILKSE